MKAYQNNTPITAADALHDLTFRGLDGGLIASATDGFSTPDYLSGEKVIGTLHVQDGEDNVIGPTIYVVEDGRPEGPAEEQIREMLSLDSAGTGWALRVVIEPGKGLLLKAEGPGYPDC